MGGRRDAAAGEGVGGGVCGVGDGGTRNAGSNRNGGASSEAGGGNRRGERRGVAGVFGVGRPAASGNLAGWRTSPLAPRSPAGGPTRGFRRLTPGLRSVTRQSAACARVPFGDAERRLFVTGAPCQGPEGRVVSLRTRGSPRVQTSGNPTRGDSKQRHRSQHHASKHSDLVLFPRSRPRGRSHARRGYARGGSRAG